MGTLARRLAEVARLWGLDPAGWQGEVDRVAHLEESDPAEALERFRALKRRLVEARRADLLAALRARPFARGLPDASTQGMTQRELERETRALERAARLAAAAQEALDDERAARASLSLRSVPEPPPLPEAPWDALAPVAEEAEARRRVARREARLEERARDAQRRARRLRARPVAVPDLSTEAVPSPDDVEAILSQAEAALAEAEEVEDALAGVERGVTADVARWLPQTRKRLLAEARAHVASLPPREAAEALRAMAPRVAEAAREAARLAEEAARARRRGGRAPEGERRAGDPTDMYG